MTGSATARVGDDAVVSATLEVNATFDPGDGNISVSVSGPVACRPVSIASFFISSWPSAG
jgi:hypothetical protein